MTYVLKENPIISRADGFRINVKGYLGNIYNITNKCTCSDHASEWIAKHSADIKTTSQAQAIVDNAIAEYNDDPPLIGSNKDTEYGSVTLE
tara:strand:+ start:833 stop:1105 length:273 start_codon:yes stop_codon:yes gene_type:complete